ncbi:ABC transporter permease [Formosa sediminum]|uniref:ABC transporter permease n=1 Tax=Formosa sediminum TaxID=2594004 RepID=A0A516GV44_9FLAO|nr:ABC transporter permease [Formosa sediminum]QDO95394.1 ABC transporter permease [Formosa sediminum]
MLALISIEFYKLFKQSKTYYALAALFIIEAVVLGSAYFQGTNIINILLDNLKQTFYFQGTLLNGNLLVYLILNTLWFHLPLILMIIVSGILTSEYKDRTVQAVMLQPINKIKFIVSKYIVAIVFTIVVVFFVALSAFVLSYGLFGKGDLIVYLNALNFFEHDDARHRLVYAFISGAFSMVFFSVSSLTMAVFFKEATKTWIVSAFFLILSNILLKVDLGEHWFNSVFYAKLNDTWQYFFYHSISWDIILQNTLFLTLYSILIMGLGIYVFNKKDIG